MDAGESFLDTHTLAQTAHLYISSTVRHLQILSYQIKFITMVEWRIFDSREIIRTYYHHGTCHLSWCMLHACFMVMQQLHEAVADACCCLLEAACCFEATA